jgi:serine/threonine protein kinase/class 3 adenylate cyclase
MTTPAPPEDRPADDRADEPPTPRSAGTDPTVNFPVPPAEDTTDLSGTFGRYTIVRRLGKGGMGRVYLARDSQLDRLVALKVPQLEAGDRANLRERFHREARAAANLHHPNICPVYDVGTVGDVPYLTMAYIEGMPLHEWVRVNPRTFGEVLAVVRKVALALEEAHRRGVIHRDLKPSNILVDHRGEPIVMDFGLARRLHLPDEARLTTPGLIIGTPAYMPPEAVLGQAESSPAGDVYSLGVILYELLAGRCPYAGPIPAVLASVISEAPPRPSTYQQGLDPRIDAVCARAMARAIHERFASMAEFAKALAALEGGVTAQVLERATSPTIEDESLPPTRWHAPAPHLAARILELLRTWGWARAIQKIRNKAQRADRESLRLAWQGFLDWLTAERLPDQQAREILLALPEGKALLGWALAGQASHLLRDRDQAGALSRLERADAQGDPGDSLLQATIAHTRGAVLVHQGQSDDAFPHLHRALDLFGPCHFMTGRVLDTLGMAYAYKGNLPVAREFYEQSLGHKGQFDDEAGVAVSHGQLGRLYLAWDELDRAEHHFQEDLRLAQKLHSRYSEAQMYNHLGQVELARGEREAAAGRKAAARRHLGTAAGWLDESIRQAHEGKFAVPEAFARKDRALVHLAEGDAERAEEQARQAAELFATTGFAEGQAKVHMVEGMILRHRERWQEAERRFRQALAHFETTQEADNIVRAYREIARTLRDAGAPVPLVTRAYREALTRAEAFRHDPLVRDIEQELHEVDVEAYLRHIYRRARGLGVDEDSPSLLEGASEVGTVLFVDLPGFAEFAQGMDPRAVLVTFNHLMADFTAVLSRHQATVLAYRGNGLMALARDARHAERGVAAALDLVAALDEFNRPRRFLGAGLFHARVGIASGDLLLGNVGTYQKMDFTAIGATVNLAGALRNEAEPGLPLISRGTYELVRERFVYQEGNPRTVSVARVGIVDVWDVLRRKT